MRDQKKNKINIAIADDHAIFLEGLVALLNDIDEINIIGTALNGIGMLDLLKTKPVDILISDINMPGMDGLELSQQVKKLYPHIAILILTMHDEQRMITNMFRAGVKGYIFKNSGKEQFVAAIKALASGEQFLSEEVKNKMITNITSGKEQKPIIPILSDREKEILQLVAKEFTTQQIADQLFISHHTVISHRKKLLFKFDVQNTAGLIKRAIETGLLD
ncbi:MAG: response regulator transcription factor [Bacteroidetes bacterium]|nr:response regulator transcription factor [Bacteroidota bacterium]